MPKRLHPLPRGASIPILITALAFLAASVALAQDQPIRVGLVRFYSSVRTVTVSARGAYTIEGPSVSLFIADSVPSTLSLDSAGVIIERAGSERVTTTPPLTITPSDPSVPLKIESRGRPAKEYRGAIEIGIRRGVLQLINLVCLEDYVRGVLPEEMPASYPLESLKAQAVTARTYALANRGKHKSEGYDLCDTNMCQHYGGALSEKPKCSQAVDETRGIVLLHSGRPAQVMYSTDCGGATQDYCEAHPGKNIPYLCSVVEPPDIPHGQWKVETTLRELGPKLVSAGVRQAQGLTVIRVASTGPSGRVIDLEITADQGTARVPGSKLRSALGLQTIKSTLYTIETLPDGSVIIQGRGWGHGHGLCQVGSKALALPPHGYDFARILAHYFPGTELSGDQSPRPVDTKQVASMPPERSPEPSPAQCIQKQNVEVTAAPPEKPSPAPEKTEKPKEGVSLRVRLKDPGHL